MRKHTNGAHLSLLRLLAPFDVEAVALALCRCASAARRNCLHFRMFNVSSGCSCWAPAHDEELMSRRVARSCPFRLARQSTDERQVQAGLHASSHHRQTRCAKIQRVMLRGLCTHLRRSCHGLRRTAWVLEWRCSRGWRPRAGPCETPTQESTQPHTGTTGAAHVLQGLRTGWEARQAPAWFETQDAPSHPHAHSYHSGHSVARDPPRSCSYQQSRP